MTRAEKIYRECGEDINKIDRKIGEMGHYFILYTHTYEQRNEEGKNLLSFPKDPRFDDAEFLGLLVDLVRDYAENTGFYLKGNKLFKSYINVLKRLERGQDV